MGLLGSDSRDGGGRRAVAFLIGGAVLAADHPVSRIRHCA